MGWSSDPYTKLLLVTPMPRACPDQQKQSLGISDFKVSQVENLWVRVMGCTEGFGEGHKDLCENRRLEGRESGVSHKKGWQQNILEGQVQRARWIPAELSLRTERLCTPNRVSQEGRQSRGRGASSVSSSLPICGLQLCPHPGTRDPDLGNKKKKEKM